jgi:hypothetical protein
MISRKRVIIGCHAGGANADPSLLIEISIFVHTLAPL